MASAFAENCELGTEEMHSGWLVKSPPLERTATTILKAVRMDSVLGRFLQQPYFSFVKSFKIILVDRPLISLINARNWNVASCWPKRA